MYILLFFFTLAFCVWEVAFYFSTQKASFYKLRYQDTVINFSLFNFVIVVSFQFS